MRSLKKLCIFAQHRTYTFEYVVVVHDNEYALVFNYTAASDGLEKTHTVLKSNIVGWSETNYPVEQTPSPSPPSQLSLDELSKQMSKQKLFKHKRRK